MHKAVDALFRVLNLEGSLLHEKCYLKIVPQFEHSMNKSNARVMFYFFKGVHLPILLPIYKALKESYPDVEVAFGYKSWEPKQRAGLSKSEIKILREYESTVLIAPNKFDPEITFIADAVYDWVSDCGKLVNVGHGILSKGLYYTDTEMARRDEAADLVCVPGSYHKEVMSHIISKPVVATGMAKLDDLFNGNIDAIAIKNELGLSNSEHKVVLYAPTFNSELSAIPVIEESIAELTKIDPNLIVLIKLHGTTAEAWKKVYYELAQKNDRIIYITEADITPLLLLADVMVSDVSSAVMEFAALDKPVILVNNPLRFKYKHHDENSVEYKFRDLGAEVKNSQEMIDAVTEAFTTPEKYSDNRVKYTNILVGNKHSGDAAKSIVREAMKLLSH